MTWSNLLQYCTYHAHRKATTQFELITGNLALMVQLWVSCVMSSMQKMTGLHRDCTAFLESTVGVTYTIPSTQRLYQAVLVPYVYRQKPINHAMLQVGFTKLNPYDLLCSPKSLLKKICTLNSLLKKICSKYLWFIPK